MYWVRTRFLTIYSCPFVQTDSKTFSTISSSYNMTSAKLNSYDIINSTDNSISTQSILQNQTLWNYTMITNLFEIGDIAYYLDDIFVPTSDMGTNLLIPINYT